MEKETKEYTPRIWRMGSRPTASRQRIPFVDNRSVNLRFPIQLGKKFDPQKPYDSSISEDNILMGREVECGFVLLSFKKGHELGNGTTLAKSEKYSSVKVACIELQVEGEIRGTPIIEVIFGPMTGKEYTEFRKVRHLLYEVLETASAYKLSLDTAIRIFNDQLTKIGKKEYKLTLTVDASVVGLMPGHTANARMIQTNLSLPLAILAADDSQKPTMESLFPPGKDRELQLFMEIRQEVNARYKKFGENVRSLLILVLFQGKLVASTPELTKQLFSVLVKASPADIIFSLLNGEEVNLLLDALHPKELAAKFGVRKEKIDNLYQTLALRKGRHIVFKEPVEDYERAYSIIPETNERVFHDMPRASGRIYNQLHAGRIVFEIRRETHPLNAKTDDPPTPADYLWERTPAVSLGAIPTFNIKGLVEQSRLKNASIQRELSSLEAQYATEKSELNHVEDERGQTFKEMKCVERELEETLDSQEQNNKKLSELTAQRKEVDAQIQASEEKMLKSKHEVVERGLSKQKKLSRQSQVKTTRAPRLIQNEINKVNRTIKRLMDIVDKHKPASYSPIKTFPLEGANHLHALTRLVPKGGVKRTAHQTTTVIRQPSAVPKVPLSSYAQQLADARKLHSVLETELNTAVTEEERKKELTLAIQAEEKKRAVGRKKSGDLTQRITQLSACSQKIVQRVRSFEEKKKTLLLKIEQLDNDINRLRINLNKQRVHLEDIWKKIAADSDQIIPPEYLEQHKKIFEKLFG